MWSTASELWREWERSRVLRPQDYDSDVADHVLRRRSVLEGYGAGSVPRALEAANWTARDLIHALAPLVSSFAGMQRDLLRLLERVGASTGTGESIRVVYEFSEDDVIDESLAAFRERLRRIEQVVVHLRPFLLRPDHAWQLPIWDLRCWEWIERVGASNGAGHPDEWRFDSAVPDADPTGDARVDDSARRIIAVVRYTLTRLESIGANTVEVRQLFRDSSAEIELDPELFEMAQVAADNWPHHVASAVHRWTAGIAEGTIAASKETLDALDSWLEGLKSPEAEEVTVEQAVDELTDVLSLPSWGKRHELYSAWIATQLDRALHSRLEFVVTDGALRFPFRPTLLAHLDPPSGDLALWSEVRSPGIGELGGGRKASVQPDYRFQRGADGTTVVAVEVKQYKAPAASRHAVTLRDYVGSLPGATVFLVAHGPLGHGILNAVPDPDRALLHPDVRPDRPRESAAFRAVIASFFPPSPPAPSPPPPSSSSPLSRPTRIELRWSRRVRDLDLYLRSGESETSHSTPVSPHSVLRKDAFDGGPEIIDLAPGLDGSLEVRVHVYSWGTLREAAPVVAFLRGKDAVLELAPADRLLGSRERWWTVAQIDEDGRVRPSLDSRVPPPSEGSR
ncbi:hypothetical protein H5399_08220 [Tessaracoccus sp. MC1627]|uniref:hypothetical protein n=1 Tax=Tessaracoccus sp. MC1627 TaxID=2760312 RepID=UPI001603D5AB|nr:hypothetical protein [Tessaracoccus sp. MC1627]MBB1512587.1 hypothetical protein [Tessaracoccus sp. MC1627]